MKRSLLLIVLPLLIACNNNHCSIPGCKLEYYPGGAKKSELLFMHGKYREISYGENGLKVRDSSVDSANRTSIALTYFDGRYVKDSTFINPDSSMYLFKYDSITHKLCGSYRMLRRQFVGENITYYSSGRISNYTLFNTLGDSVYCVCYDSSGKIIKEEGKPFTAGITTRDAEAGVPFAMHIYIGYLPGWRVGFVLKDVTDNKEQDTVFALSGISEFKRDFFGYGYGFDRTYDSSYSKSQHTWVLTYNVIDEYNVPHSYEKMFSFLVK